MRIAVFRRPNQMAVAVNPTYVQSVEPSAHGASIVLAGGEIITVTTPFDETVRRLSTLAAPPGMSEGSDG